MEDVSKGWFGLPWWVYGLIALVVALVYMFFVPKGEAIAALTGIRWFILRWMHSIVWILLAFSFFMRMVPALAAWANPVAVLGGICYAIFMISFISLK